MGKKNKRKINIFNDAKKAAKNADVIFSDKVVSLNDKVNKVKKIKDFKNYRINKSLMKVTRPNHFFTLLTKRTMKFQRMFF